MGATPGADEEPVLVVTPTRRDAEVTCNLLSGAGVDCVICDDLAALARRLPDGAGAVVLTDAALHDPAMAAVVEALAQQPAWSDIPTLLLSREKGRTAAAAEVLAGLTNVTLLDRPSSTTSMVSAVQSALRSRRRQFQIREQMARQLLAEAALRDADTRKDEFLATLAHELRNPLAAIFTAVQLLGRSQADGAKVDRTVGLMDRQTRLLIKLIDDLMDVSRITTGKVLLQPRRIDMRTVIEAALETGQALLQAARHEVRIDLPAAPVWVMGDSPRLTQVIGNLVNNAGKYTPPGGRITVTLNEEAGQAVVRVADNGVGIPADMLPRVFEMFTQVNRTLDRAEGGLGIGLALVRRLMALHGGEARVDSAGIDQGSVFTIALPVAEPVRPALATPSTAPIDVGSALAKRLRILVVDDNPDVAEVLAEFLRIDGHEIRTEHGGAAGLSAASTFQPDVVFCDVGMPGVDGHQVAARLRSDSRFASTLLVAVTGWGTEDEQRRTRDAGFDLHLTKPVDFDAVGKILAAPQRSA